MGMGSMLPDSNLLFCFCFLLFYVDVKGKCHSSFIFIPHIWSCRKEWREWEWTEFQRTLEKPGTNRKEMEKVTLTTEGKKRQRGDKGARRKGRMERKQNEKGRWWSRFYGGTKSKNFLRRRHGGSAQGWLRNNPRFQGAFNPLEENRPTDWLEQDASLASCLMELQEREKGLVAFWLEVTREGSLELVAFAWDPNVYVGRQWAEGDFPTLM